MTEQNHHYFATHALGFNVGATRQEAIEKLARMHLTDLPAWIKNCQADGKVGVPVWTCRVPLAIEGEGTNYRIESYMPKVDGLDDIQEVVLTKHTKKATAYSKDFESMYNRQFNKLADAERRACDLEDVINTILTFGGTVHSPEAVEALKGVGLYEHDAA